MDIIRTLEKENMKENLPNLMVGDYVKVAVKVKEGVRERLQIFEGYLIGMHGSGIRRAIVVRRGKVRRAKLYYLRDRVGKAARIKEDIKAKR